MLKVSDAELNYMKEYFKRELIRLNDKRLDIAINRDDYRVELAILMRQAANYGVNLFDEAN